MGQQEGGDTLDSKHLMAYIRGVIKKFSA